MQTSISIIVDEFNEWDISWILAYKRLKELEKQLKEAFNLVEDNVFNLVQDCPAEYPEFSIMTRTTYNFKENEKYVEIQESLKSLEKDLKTATDMNKLNRTYIDENGEAISPIDFKQTSYITYKPKKEKK